jgi:hypothetical protein
MATIDNNEIIQPNINNLTVYEQNLIDSWVAFFNTLLNISVYNVYIDKNNNQLCFQQNNQTLCFDFSLTGLPDVNVSNLQNGDVLVYNGTNFINTNISDTLNYVNNNPSTRFSDITDVVSVSDALNKILYPYVSPTFTSFSIQGVPSILELGQYINNTSGGVQIFNWGVSELSNISTSVGYNLLDITNSYTIATGILPYTTTTTTQMIPYGIHYTTTGATNDFRIVGKNTNGVFFQRDITYTWLPRIFWGTSNVSSPLTNSQILNLPASSSGGTALVSSIQNSFTMNGNGAYLWICMPASFGKAIQSDGSSSLFIVGGLANSFWNIYTVNFTNQFGYTSSYYLYRSVSVSFGTSIKISIV